VPRRSAGSLRSRGRGRGPAGARYRDVPGLSGAANAAIRVFERERLSPGEVLAALRVWSARVHGSRTRPRAWEAGFTCRCCGGEWARDVLARALAGLPSRAAAELRCRVGRLDRVLLARTLHDPRADPELPWWRRRC
jgi:hypothetical protein